MKSKRRIQFRSSFSLLFGTRLEKAAVIQSTTLALSVYIPILVIAQSQSLERTGQTGLYQPSDNKMLVSYL